MADTQMAGKVVVVTGANSGLGRATTEALAVMGARVIMVGRNEQKLNQAREAIGDKIPDAQLAIELADFARLAEVRELGERVAADYPNLDVLVNNAGVAYYKRTLTEDGFEMTFAVNHLAPFVLTHFLLPSLQRAPKARIVNVASEAYRRGALDFDDLQTERNYKMGRAYNRSKLCNILFSRFLVGRLVGTDVTVNMVHPGLVNTGIGTGGNLPTRIFRKILRVFASSPQRGARTQVWVATSDELDDRTGAYYANCSLAKLRPVGLDDMPSGRLWNISCKLTGIESHSYGKEQGQQD